jgi:hypothetical protein
VVSGWQSLLPQATAPRGKYALLRAVWR